MLLTLGACASLPHTVDKSPSVALADPASTTIGRLAAAAVRHPRLSGVHLLASGEEALASLIALAESAQRTIDIQQYIIKPDASARVVMERVHAAAERGVRVRLLVDDFNTSGMDQSFLQLATHRNIEVRLFNPFPAGRMSMLTRFIASAGDLRRINRRMHNKQFIADNALAITGGRNIGDEYFVRDQVSNFLDLDVLVAGRVVPQLSSIFDRYWNSEFAYPVESLARPAALAKAARAANPEKAHQPVQTPAVPGSPALEVVLNTPDPALPAAAAALAVAAPVARTADFLKRDLARGALTLLSAPATVLADAPSKIGLEDAPDLEETVADDLGALMAATRSDLIIVSPYFVPGPKGMDLFRALRARGVRVRVLTNSLATTDAPAVHVGYARYRPSLVGLGVELHEMKAGLVQNREPFTAFGSSRASLHAKALVIDGRTVFIGSLNMDPRSANINSEMGVLIRSRAIATQVGRLFGDVVTHNSYRIVLSGTNGEIRWLSGAGANTLSWDTEPETKIWQRLLIQLMAPFAPDELL